MMILKGVYYSRPTERYLSVERVPVEGNCPDCRGQDIRRYPAFTAKGPRFVTKCQDCLALVAVEGPSLEDAHPPFCPMTRNWDASRAG
jgi:hypothetical protein